MAFIATPAFSNLYGGGILTVGPAPTMHMGVVTSSFPAQQPQNQSISTIGINPNGSVLHTYHDPANTAMGQQGSQKKFIDPFDPAAAVPLPFQLEEHSFTTTVWKRNERERYRVRCVNDGYQRLRMHLPIGEDEKRISKVDTLRLAIRYIRHLSEILRNDNHMMRCRCFDRFTEESEGNVRVLLGAMGQRR